MLILRRAGLAERDRFYGGSWQGGFHFKKNVLCAVFSRGRQRLASELHSWLTPVVFLNLYFQEKNTIGSPGEHFVARTAARTVFECDSGGSRFFFFNKPTWIRMIPPVNE